MADNYSKNKKNPEPGYKSPVVWVVLGLLVVALLGTVFGGMNGQGEKDNLITSEFVAAVEQGRVTEVVYNAGEYTVTGTYYPAITAGARASETFNDSFDALSAGLSDQGEKGSVQTQDLPTIQLGQARKYSSTYVGQDSLQELMAKHPEIKYQITLPSGFTNILISLLPILLIAGIMLYFFNQMQKSTNSQMGFGKAKAKKTTEERPDVRFSDVAGVDEALEEMKEIKDFLSNPEKYQAMGAKIPRGALLVGPPGTGKTLMARAVAGEAGVPFFSISGSDFVEMFVGVGASRVRDLFQQAKDAAPAIIFIDEIDAVGRQRGAGVGGGHDEREQTLNQLLVEMDGFEKNDSVVLIAATNRADILDPALLRPGRFDRQIVVDTPDVRGREQILKVHAANKPLGSDVDLARVAQITPGFTGADLMNLMNESAILAARRNKHLIGMTEINESMERVIAGPERKGRVMNEQTKNIIAYHESGHALIGHKLEKADPVHKISIISRGRALGYTLSIPDEDKVLNSVEEMKAELCVLMGGRVAEELFCGDITTGASNDLERASKIARSMVTQYGMSPLLGHQVFGEANHEVFLGRDYGNTRNYSEETAELIDDEVTRILKEAHDETYRILSENADQMHLMAKVLRQRETIDGIACEMLLDNKWDEFLAMEDDLKAKAAAEEAAASARNAQLLAEQAQAAQAASETQLPGGGQGGSVNPYVQLGQNGQPVQWNPYAVPPQNQVQPQQPQPQQPAEPAQPQQPVDQPTDQPKE